MKKKEKSENSDTVAMRHDEDQWISIFLMSILWFDRKKTLLSFNFWFPKAFGAFFFPLIRLAGYICWGFSYQL